MQKKIDVSKLNNMILKKVVEECNLGMFEADNKYNSELYPHDLTNEVTSLYIEIEITFREMNKPTHAKKH